MHAVRAIPFHRASGLDKALRSLVWQVQAGLRAGDSGVIDRASTEAVQALQDDVARLAFTGVITAS